MSVVGWLLVWVGVMMLLLWVGRRVRVFRDRMDAERGAGWPL